LTRALAQQRSLAPAALAVKEGGAMMEGRRHGF
jgi:hypothetical protein